MRRPLPHAQAHLPLAALLPHLHRGAAALLHLPLSPTAAAPPPPPHTPMPFSTAASNGGGGAAANDGSGGPSSPLPTPIQSRDGSSRGGAGGSRLQPAAPACGSLVVSVWLQPSAAATHGGCLGSGALVWGTGCGQARPSPPHSAALTHSRPCAPAAAPAALARLPPSLQPALSCDGTALPPGAAVHSAGGSLFCDPCVVHLRVRCARPTCRALALRPVWVCAAKCSLQRFAALQRSGWCMAAGIQCQVVHVLHLYAGCWVLWGCARTQDGASTTAIMPSRPLPRSRHPQNSRCHGQSH